MKIAFDIARSFWANEDGATAIEYVVLIGFMGAVIITAIASMNDALVDVWSKNTETFKNRNTPSGASP